MPTMAKKIQSNISGMVSPYPAIYQVFNKTIGSMEASNMSASDRKTRLSVRWFAS